MAMDSAATLNNKYDKLLGLDKVKAEQSQKEGVLIKKAMFRNKKTPQKWKKRYFVAKDGFLFWYKYHEKPRQKHFDTSPAGAIPLGGCTIRLADKSGVFSIVSNDLSDVGLYLRASDLFSCEEWMHNLELCTKATWENAILGNALIQQMKSKGTGLEQEKNQALEKAKAAALELKNTKEAKEKAVTAAMQDLESKEAELQKQFDKQKDLASTGAKKMEALNEVADVRKAEQQKRISLENKLAMIMDTLDKLKSSFLLSSTDAAGVPYSDNEDLEVSVKDLRSFFELKQREQALRARATYEIVH